MNKLIYHDGTIGAIYFPPGKLKEGGTCEFATKKCLYDCGLRTNSIEIDTYEFFKEKPVKKIVERIVKDLSVYPRKVLRWFAAGDCPRRLENKIIEIMKCLEEQRVHQVGFTRNPHLWKKVEHISNLHLILTIDAGPFGAKKRIKEICEKNQRRQVGIPEYTTGRVQIYSWGDTGRGIYHVGGCGSGWTTYNQGLAKDVAEKDFKLSEEDCGICYDKKIGCFVERVFV